MIILLLGNTSCLLIVFIYLIHLLLSVSCIIVICMIRRRDACLCIILGICNTACIVMVLLLWNLFRSRSWSLLSQCIILICIIYLLFLAICRNSVNLSWSMTASRMANHGLMLASSWIPVRFAGFVLLTWLGILSWRFRIWLLLIGLSILIFH